MTRVRLTQRICKIVFTRRVFFSRESLIRVDFALRLGCSGFSAGSVGSGSLLVWG